MAAGGSGVVGGRWRGAVVAGPFGSRADAAYAEPPSGDDWSEVEELRPAYGSGGPSGELEVRPSPADRAFEAYLDEQLARVPGSCHAGGADRPLGEVTRAVGAALVEAGSRCTTASVGRPMPPWAGCA